MPLFFGSSGQRGEQGASEARKRPSGAFGARCACRGVITPRASLVARSKKEVTTYVVTSFLERATRLARGVITPRHAQRAPNAPLGRFLASLAPCSPLCPLEPKNKGMTYVMPLFFGAGDEARTRYLHLGKVALYQMSYARKWCLRPESNWRHADFQSAALPTELPRHIKPLLQPDEWRPGRGSNPRPPA